MSVNQQQFQMALWCILSAPLFVSSDLRTIRSESKKILLNRRAIAINQDPLGQLGLEILVVCGAFLTLSLMLNFMSILILVIIIILVIILILIPLLLTCILIIFILILLCLFLILIAVLIFILTLILI